VLPPLSNGKGFDIEGFLVEVHDLAGGFDLGLVSTLMGYKQ